MTLAVAVHVAVTLCHHECDDVHPDHESAADVTVYTATTVWFALTIITAITRGQSNLTTGHIAHGVTPPNTCFIGPLESKSQTASRSVQPFLHSSLQRVATLYNGLPSLPQNCPFPCGSGLHLMHGSLGPLESSTQMASRLVQPLFQGSQLWQTDQQTTLLGR